MYKLKSLIIVFLLVGIVGMMGLILSHEGFTGAMITHKVSCYNDADCNDRIAETADVCKNPGTEFSLCVNKPKE